MTRMATSTPARKVVAASLGSAVTVLMFAGLEYFLGRSPSAEIQGAVLVVVTFLLGYYVPPAATDQVVVETQP